MSDLFSQFFGIGQRRGFLEDADRQRGLAIAIGSQNPRTQRSQIGTPPMGLGAVGQPGMVFGALPVGTPAGPTLRPPTLQTPREVYGGPGYTDPWTGKRYTKFESIAPRMRAERDFHGGLRDASVAARQEMMRWMASRPGQGPADYYRERERREAAVERGGERTEERGFREWQKRMKEAEFEEEKRARGVAESGIARERERRAKESEEEQRRQIDEAQARSNEQSFRRTMASKRADLEERRLTFAQDQAKAKAEFQSAKNTEGQKKALVSAVRLTEERVVSLRKELISLRIKEAEIEANITMNPQARDALLADIDATAREVSANHAEAVELLETLRSSGAVAPQAEGGFGEEEPPVEAGPSLEGVGGPLPKPGGPPGGAVGGAPPSPYEPRLSSFPERGQAESQRAPEQVQFFPPRGESREPTPLSDILRFVPGTRPYPPLSPLAQPTPPGPSREEIIRSLREEYGLGPGVPMSAFVGPHGFGANVATGLDELLLRLLPASMQMGRDQGFSSGPLTEEEARRFYGGGGRSRFLSGLLGGPTATELPAGVPMESGASLRDIVRGRGRASRR